MESAVLVAGLHLRWNGVWQRPHHLLSRLARFLPIIVVEEPLPAPRDDHAISHGAQNLTVVRPLRRAAAAGEPLDPPLRALVRRLAGDRSVLLWLYTPLMLDLALDFPAAPIVFDAMDDLAGFAGAPPNMRAREDQLLACAHTVFAGGASLARALSARAPGVRLYPSGVDAAFFERAHNRAPHPLMEALPPPRFVYTGVIDERLDYDLITALADARPGAQIVMAGPVAKIDPACLPRRANVHFTGRLPYAELPALLAGAEAGLLPFARNAATAAISPTKTLEYLAAGLPVVGTPIRDVVDAFADLVLIAADGPAFIAACDRAPGGRTGAWRARALAAARAAGWDTIAQAMWADCAFTG